MADRNKGGFGGSASDGSAGDVGGPAAAPVSPSAPKARRTGRRWWRRQPAAGGLAAAATLAVVIAAASEATSGFARTDGGHVAVVRNGGPFSDTKIRSVISPGSSLQHVGVVAGIHRYPSNQRFYTIASNGRGDRPGVDVVNVPTADGIDVGVEGTIYFTRDLDQATLRDFDTEYGTRTYRGADGARRTAYDGEDGWNSFLDQIVRPVIDNDIRIAVGQYRCSDLVPSCALVQNGTAAPSGTVALPSGVPTGNVNLSKIESALASSLQADLAGSLGGGYLSGVRRNLSKITLPPSIQDAVNAARAAHAGVSQSQAKVKQAQLEAQANVERQKGYNAGPACSQIDIINALPTGVTVYAPGSGSGLPLTTAGR